MSNVSKTSENLKKKLSFDDYSAPSDSDTIASSSTSSNHTAPNDTAGKSTASSEPTRSNKGGSKTNGKQKSNSETECNTTASNKTTSSTTTGSGTNSSPTLADIYGLVEKKKVTFYLDEQAQEELFQIYVKRVKEKKRLDKSALVCKVIHMLYEKEM